MQNVSHYKNHLYFENNKDSKEYQLNKCISILGIISIVKDRNETIKEFCKEVYGLDANGKVLTTPDYLERYNHNLDVINRLKKYYNYCLNKVEKFNL